MPGSWDEPESPCADEWRKAQKEVNCLRSHREGKAVSPTGAISAPGAMHSVEREELPVGYSSCSRLCRAGGSERQGTGVMF